MTLTHLQITNAKPRETAHKLPDTAGLYLVVQPTGAKLWRMNYRYLGRQKTLHFGAWPAVGIAAARERRDEARQQLAAGLDPAAEKGAAMHARKMAADNTFKTIAEEWVAKNERRAARRSPSIRFAGCSAWPIRRSAPGRSRRSLPRKCSPSCDLSRRPAATKARAGCAVCLAASSATPSPPRGPIVTLPAICVAH